MSFWLLVLIVILSSLAVGLAAMFMEHVRKMAEIQAASRGGDARVEALERRVADLTELVHQQTITLDGVGRPAMARDNLERRIEA